MDDKKDIISKIEKRQTLIIIGLLVQALSIWLLVAKVDMLIGVVNDLSKNIVDFCKQINISTMYFNDFIRLFVTVFV